MNTILKIYKHFLLSDGVSTDSREDVTNKIFFALSGDNFDGNKYALDAYKKGARLCIIDNNAYEVSNSVLVPNTLVALQNLAKYHREQNTATVLAITGTNGKTTTKELVSSVLGTFTDIISTKGNFNNHIGVPLTLLRIVKSTKIAVIEMGANHIGEISKLCEIAQPNIGIITNIGKAHLEGFGSFEGVITAKSELYTYIRKNNGKIIVNSDDELLVNLSNDIRRFTYGTNNADVNGKLISTIPYLKITWGDKDFSNELLSQLYGEYNFSNIMAAIATGVFFGVESNSINSSIAGYLPQNNRSQIITTDNNHVVMDAYNANPTSMKGAISSFAEYKFKNPYYLLGDMFELGSYSATEHQMIVDFLMASNIKNVILLGNEFCNTINHSYLCFNNTQDGIKHLKDNRIIDSTILVKGSRGMKLETILKIL